MMDELKQAIDSIADMAPLPPNREMMRLRDMLDERGIEWKELDSVHPITVWHDGQTSYEYMERTLLDGVTPYTGEVVDGTGRLEAVIHVCTPEQAIAATVGAKTSHAVACNVTDCIHNRECRCTCADLEIQDQECLTYRCVDIDYGEEEE